MNKFSKKTILEEFGDFNTRIGDKYTFAGVVLNQEIWCGFLSKNWNEQTQKNYFREYCKYFFNYLNDKPLEKYEKTDFDNVMIKIKAQRRKEGTSTSTQIIRHFEYIMRRVTKAAAEYHICEDVLWGSRYDISDTKKDDEKLKDSLVRLQKSLSINEEKEITRRLLYDEKQQGEYFGLALMFCLGLRENEACAASFEDIKPFKCDPNRYCLWVYKTSDKNTRDTKFGGKTGNAPRIIPMPDKLVELIQRRRKYLQNILPKEKRKHLERWPIACSKEYHIQCRPSELSVAGTRLLREAKINEKMMSYFDDALQYEQYNKEPGVIEKDPTAYLFRRNAATHFYILGLDDNEIQYIIGHDIEDPNDERNYFRNEEKLYQIAKKMWKRPLINNLETENRLVEQFYSSNNISTIHLDLQTGETGSRYRMMVRQREPHSKTEIKIDGNCEGQYYRIPNTNPYSPTTNISAIYQEKYRRN